VRHGILTPRMLSVTIAQENSLLMGREPTIINPNCP
jgi:hypothetical protein